ncbi:CarD family transcriptional regulator [Propionimicrobium sp. PCR01-08-3]|uniref:CarD family transcriptional regulator n=1 Tax=Propionimicrobium sp. PCR01-08-3 TaxID=3052086 RepID=UPI00255CAC83|nr:CarD family transcriptional regulator [Propionimicrobium sp. PCR01-08-3]WIY82677.1 CarD family transcriptional regulator [Propionimicrobium sp. PCR01-08-3]
MKFHVGQTVIHPHHGPAAVTKVMTRKVRGEQVEYVELEVVSNKLMVSLPVSKAEEIGIRDVAGVHELDKLAEVLSGPTVGEEPQWSRRYKANRASIATGDPLQLAAVVRDLVRRRERGSLSLGEKDLLKEASAPLLAEIALAINISEDDALEVMHSMILEESRDALDALDERAEAV